MTEKNQDKLEEVREVLWPFLSGSSNSDPESVASGLSSASGGQFGVPRPGSSASILREHAPRVETMPTFRCTVMLSRHRPRWETRKHRIDRLWASRLEDVEVSTFRVRIPYLTCVFFK